MSNASIWRLYSPFRSAVNVQNFLLTCYEKEKIEDAEKRSYENCYPFIYYLEHGQNYYQLAGQAPLSIKPILLFYGMVQLLKGCLLTVDPQYPESTSVLAHGVSTRKRKKQNFEFLQDEVKIQKNGLFPHFSKELFQLDHLESEKYSMKYLFKRIPEMDQLFLFSEKKTNHYLIGSIYDTTFQVTENILDDLKMTFERLSDFLQSQSKQKLTISKNTNKNVLIEVPDILKPIHSEPFSFDFYKQTYHIPKDRKYFHPFSEIMTHYLLLYNLSMICRYETEWWSDLLHTFSSVDFPFIQNFVGLTEEKIPYLLFLFLNEKRTSE